MPEYERLTLASRDQVVLIIVYSGGEAQMSDWTRVAMAG
jgi:hypothetical protein